METANNPLEGDEFWNAGDCARFTGVPQGTWRYWAHARDESKPRSFKLGRRRVWRKSVVLQWIAEQEAKAD